ncbi:MAG: outer membrane beta-barrel protein [Deltaproteobacteria bacterium]|nr:outer membrane beta-barrel protein [Deltaproteobacteria bacterium]
MHSVTTSSLALALLLSAGVASAQQETDRVVMPSASDWTKPQPSADVQVQGGVQGATGGLGAATVVGPSAQVRVAYGIFQWLSIGANYGIAGQGAERSMGDATVVTQAFFGDVRATAPFGLFRPYAFGGIGYGWNRVRSDASTPLAHTDNPLLPVGVGLNFMVSKAVAVGPQASYTQTLSSSRHDPINGGNYWNAGLSATYQMQL